ncbi:hypothetical protein JCGZ_04047 [Jatropha curcas]|uniref:U1-type domain-containing protein n=1 Tax=Jatropha curcas TaxID=180498 RepID=A0A067L3P2_JATCU|nr:uncharacterized protein LOC105633612 [Jatropha curcas]KDP38694.1 hypothetical protein JCGZ_04047 [Jatropha curcas]
MEFKFRAVDGRPRFTYESSSTTAGYFSEQEFRAAYTNILNPELMRNEMLQREIKKERIREEIITGEIVRRRMLEAEVRRELMMEREMAMRAGIEGGLSFEERLTMGIRPRVSCSLNDQFYNRRLEMRPPFPARGVFDQWLQPPRLSEALVAPDVKPASEYNQSRLIVLAKPDPNLCRAKRKAATIPAGDAGELCLAGLKKKPKEEWSCALCQVSATSENGLNEHLRGKKHKAKEARLRATKMAKNLSALQLPKKTAKPAELTIGVSCTELEAKVEESLQVIKSNYTEKKIGNEKDSGKKNEKQLKQKNKGATSVKKDVAAKLQREKRTEEFRKKKKFKFWCEECHVGAYSTMVMEAHKMGKKHADRLRKLDQNGKTVLGNASMESSKADRKAKNDIIVADKANENLTDNSIKKESKNKNCCR